MSQMLLKQSFAVIGRRSLVCPQETLRFENPRAASHNGLLDNYGEYPLKALQKLSTPKLEWRLKPRPYSQQA